MSVGSSGRLSFLGFLEAVAFDVEFEDDAVVDEAVDGGHGGHGIFEDLLPLRKRQIAGDHDAAALIAMRQQVEKHLHLLATVLHVADVVDDDRNGSTA